MKELMALLDNDEFADFILHEYFKDKDMTAEEKFSEVGASLYDFKQAMERFKLSAREDNNKQ